MKSRIFIVLSVCFCLLFGISAAKKQLEISVFVESDYNMPTKNNKIFKWMKDKFGVTFKWDILKGDLAQKTAIMIVSGDLPDLVQVSNTNFEDADCLRPLEDYIEKYCPNLKKHYKQYWNRIKSEDGHIYVLPNYGVFDGEQTDTSYLMAAFWIHKDVLKEFNYPKIQTLDEYFDLLKKYVTLYPQKKAFSSLVSDWEYFNMMDPAYYLAGYPNDGSVYVEEKNGKYTAKSVYSAEFTKKWLSKLNDYYQQGLVDPQIFTDSRNDFFYKLQTSYLMGFYAQSWEFMYMDQNINSELYVPLALTFDSNIQPQYKYDVPNVNRGFGITVKCSEEKTIQILQLMDTLMEEENQKVFNWGFEGEDYLLDSNGVPYRTQKQINDSYTSDEWKDKHYAALWYELAPKWQGAYSDGNPLTIDQTKKEYYKLVGEDKLEVLEAYDITSYADLMGKYPFKYNCWFPMWNAYIEPGSKAELFNRTYDIIIKKYYEKFITCKKSEFNTIWKQYVSDLKAINEDDYVQYMQKELDYRVKKWK